MLLSPDRREEGGKREGEGGEGRGQREKEEI
jgi:hypothetical protein